VQCGFLYSGRPLANFFGDDKNSEKKILIEFPDGFDYIYSRVYVYNICNTVAVDAPSSAALLAANSRRLLEFRSAYDS